MNESNQESLYTEINFQSVGNAIDVINGIADITNELDSQKAVEMGVQARIVACYLLKLNELLLNKVSTIDAVNQVSNAFKD